MLDSGACKRTCFRITSRYGKKMCASRNIHIPILHSSRSYSRYASLPNMHAFVPDLVSSTCTYVAMSRRHRQPAVHTMYLRQSRDYKDAISPTAFQTLLINSHRKSSIPPSEKTSLTSHISCVDSSKAKVPECASPSLHQGQAFPPSPSPTKQKRFHHRPKYR